MSSQQLFGHVNTGIPGLNLQGLMCLGKDWPLGSRICDVFLCFVTFSCGVLGRAWYLIVSIHDLCFPPYFVQGYKAVIQVRLCPQILGLESSTIPTSHWAPRAPYSLN